MEKNESKPIYVSAVDAGILIGKSTRTIHWFIQQGRLQARHKGPNQLLILLTDAEARAREKPAVVTPLVLIQGQALAAEDL